MGLLGRFQIVAASFVFILLLAAAALVTAVEVLEPGTGDLPVSIGEVSRTTMASVVGIVLVMTVLLSSGGMLLLASAEGLEAASGDDPRVSELLGVALRKLRGYFVLESLVMAGVVAAAAALLGWPGL